uniref:UBA domain-containing protein n=1 Tax=Dunaliella tertiolecta TaxID=3047 RepID=A0A7S3R4D2_DUNTE
MELLVHSGSRGGKPERLALADTSRVGEVLDAVCKQELGSDGAGRKARVVHQGRILDESQASMTLKEAGLVHGDSLLVFALTPIPMPGAPQTWPAPSSSAIKSAVLTEAKKQGIEPQMRARRSHTVSQPYFPSELASLEQPLLQLLQAFNPRGVASRGGPGAASGGLAADPVAAAMQQLANAFDVPVSELHGGRRPRRGGGDDEEEEEEEEEEDDDEQEGPAEIRPPEPSAQAVEQLTGMGFLEPVVRKALVLGRNNVDAALDWLLVHSEDADAAEPPTQQQLRQVYGAPSSQTIAESEAVDQLCEMGFERPAVTSAIRRFRNMELALAYLLQTASSSPSAPASAPANPPPAPPSGPPSAPPTDHRSEHPSSTPSSAGPPGRAGQVASALDAAATPNAPPLTHTPPRVTHSIPHPTPEEEQQQQQPQGDGNQGDVDMDAHREDAQHGGSSRQQEGQGLQDLMSQLQAQLPPHWRHLAQHMEQSLLSAAREQGLPSDVRRVDPSAILAGMARGGQGAQLFAGVPLPPDFAEALQRAEHDYGGQANLVAAAQQMAQMLEHMTGSGEGGGGGSGTHNNSGVDSGSDGQW